ncbi:MAG: Gfo/Idh/MocA family oxidoreductase [Nitrospiraceae bacterium]|nr:MAG: Gfo/Idh/MocA family oxidoreductase [Nitrospiraceae bacterium]
MTDNKKFIAQIGLGYWGKNILRNLYELDVLHTACDTSGDIISGHKEKYPEIHYTSSVSEILESSDIKAVVISSPAITHYDFVKKSLLAGKDVFVEKPLSLDVEDAAELVEIAVKEGKILMVGHILQYHPAVIKLREMIFDGKLGKVQYIYSNRLNIGKLRTEENILWSFAPHDISVILSLVGEEPIRISSMGGDYLSNGVYDTTMTSLEFSNGIKSHIFVSWLHPFKEQKLVVVGSKAMAVFDDMSREKLFIYPHKIEWKSGKIPVAQKADFHTVPLDQKEPLKEELKHFIDCIRERKSPQTDGHEGLRVLRVLELAENAMLSSSQAKSPYISETQKYYLHESSFVDDNVIIGDATKIWHFSHILSDSKIGKKCIIGQNVTIGPEVTIGNNCKVQNNVSIYKGVTLEDAVFCGPSCVFTNVYNPRAFVERKNEFYNTVVKKGATIGANATIVCGITIGQYALIGAGAVVKSDVPDYAVIAGVPAKQKGWACKCGVPLKFIKDKSTCKNCKSRYALKKKKLVIVKEEI